MTGGGWFLETLRVKVLLAALILALSGIHDFLVLALVITGLSVVLVRGIPFQRLVGMTLRNSPELPGLPLPSRPRTPYLVA